MKQIYKFLIIFVMISMASAAVLVAINPLGLLTFTREYPSPAPGDPTVETLIECGIGYASVCDMGPMTTNTLNKNIEHYNIHEPVYNGIVLFNITCSEGLYLGTGGGMSDFSSITFTDPWGNTSSCNNGACIERVDINTITITPIMETFSFEYETPVYSNINIEFVDNAYGNYTIAIWVDIPSV
jgi:hypothetical protein